MIGIDQGVATLSGSALIREFFKTLTVPWDGRVEPWVGIGVDVDHGSEGAAGGTIRVKRALIKMNNVERGSVSVGISFYGTGIEMGIFPFDEHMVAHSKTLRAKGCSVSVQVYTPVIEEMGKGLFAIAG